MSDTADFSKTVNNIDRMLHLTDMPLDDAEATWEEWVAVRKVIIIFLQVCGLWDYILDFAQAVRNVPWADKNQPDVYYKVVVYDNARWRTYWRTTKRSVGPAYCPTPSQNGDSGFPPLYHHLV